MAQRQIKSLSPKALAILDWMIAHPQGRYAECAAALGVGENWISIVANSGVFRAELQRRRSAIEEELAERMVRATSCALDRLADEVERSDNPWFLLRATEVLLKHCAGAGTPTDEGCYPSISPIPARGW